MHSRVTKLRATTHINQLTGGIKLSGFSRARRYIPRHAPAADRGEEVRTKVVLRPSRKRTRRNAHVKRKGTCGRAPERRIEQGIGGGRDGRSRQRHCAKVKRLNPPVTLRVKRLNCRVTARHKTARVVVLAWRGWH